MYTTLLGHLSFALAFAGAFVVVLVLVTELARAVRLVESSARRRKVWQPWEDSRLGPVANENGQSDSAAA